MIGEQAALVCRRLGERRNDQGLGENERGFGGIDVEENRRRGGIFGIRWKGKRFLLVLVGNWSGLFFKL